MERVERAPGAARRVEEPRVPPQWLLRLMNLVPNALLRSPLHGLMSERVLLLGFTGRRSGRVYTTPMSYAREGDEILMSTEAPWWRNLAGGAAVGLRLRGQEVRGFARVHSGGQDAAEGLRRLVERYPGGYARFLGVTLDGSGKPDPEGILRAVERGRVFVSVRIAGDGEAGH